MNCTIDPKTEQIFICFETPEEYEFRLADHRTLFTEYFDENRFAAAEFNYVFASSD